MSQKCFHKSYFFQRGTIDSQELPIIRPHYLLTTPSPTLPDNHLIPYARHNRLNGWLVIIRYGLSFPIIRLLNIRYKLTTHTHHGYFMLYSFPIIRLISTRNYWMTHHDPSLYSKVRIEYREGSLPIIDFFVREGSLPIIAFFVITQTPL